MKLVRLASSNDGVFTSNFGNDMILEENSKMALLNLTFTSDIGQIVITDDMTITSWTDHNIYPGTALTKSLSGQKFPSTQKGYDDFIETLEYYLNTTLEIGRGKTQQYNSSGSQYRIIKNNGGKYTIVFRYSPFINPMDFYSSSTPRAKLMEYNDQEIDVVTTTTGVGPPPQVENLTIIQPHVDITTANVLNENNMISSTPISMGCGFMSARVADLVDNGSGLQDNGFAIGLSNVALRDEDIFPGDEIPLANIFAEIRINTPLEPYKYTTQSFDNVPSFIYPNRVAATPLVNGYLNLPLGNDWTQAPTPATERFDSLDLGPIATFRRVQDGGGSIHWWEATSATTWNIYTTKPLLSTDTPSNTANADLTTGVLTNVTGGATFTPSGYGATPDIVNLPINVNVHDVMGIEIYKGKLELVVYTNLASPNNRNVIETITLKPGQKLYPYLYINGKRGDVKIDMFNWTADSLVELDSNNMEIDYAEAGWGPDAQGELYDSQDKQGVRNGLQVLQEEVLASNIANAMPSLYWQDTNDRTRWEVDDLEFTLNMPNEIYRYLGYSEYSNDGNTTSRGFIPLNVWTLKFTSPGLPLIYKSDNFIVESTTLRLDSYDASKVQYNTTQLFNANAELSGRRKNILMTIPTNDNTKGLVEFQTNTPIFIDIGNTEKINVKNLNLRVLRKDFSPIKQGDELAIMTLLIDN